MSVASVLTIHHTVDLVTDSAPPGAVPHVSSSGSTSTASCLCTPLYTAGPSATENGAPSPLTVTGAETLSSTNTVTSSDTSTLASTSGTPPIKTDGKTYVDDVDLSINAKDRCYDTSFDC